MKAKAAEVASKGRYGDTMLVHMNPLEVKAMHEASPMGLTINPDTGQPEAFLPMLMGLGGGWLGSMYGPAMYGAAAGAGLGSFGGAKMSGYDTQDALMAGLLAGGTTAALGAFGDAALEPNAGDWGYSEAGASLDKQVVDEELARRAAAKYGPNAHGFDRAGTPVFETYNQQIADPRPYSSRFSFTSTPAYKKAFEKKPTFMDRVSAPWGEDSPSFEQTFGRAVKNPAFYSGAAAAGLGAFGGGLDPLMGVPQYDIPEVEEDEPRGPNKHLGQNKVFWAKPASWTDADGEWQFYWPQGVTPPGYAHGGIVKAYAAGGYVDPGERDPDARRAGRQQAWGFRTPDPVSRRVDAPVVDPTTGDPEMVSPLLIDEGGYEPPPEGPPPPTSRPSVGGLFDDERGQPTDMTGARAADYAAQTASGLGTLGQIAGYSNPITAGLTLGLGQVARGLSNDYWGGIGGQKAYGGAAKHAAGYRGPIGFWEDISRPDILYGSPETIQRRRSEAHAWGGTTSDVGDAAAKAARQDIADTIAAATWATGDEYDTVEDVLSGIEDDNWGDTESSSLRGGGLVRGFQEGGIASLNDYRRDQVASATGERTANLGGPYADINSVAKAAVHELMHEGFDAADVKGPFPPVQSLIGGEKRPVKLNEELLVRLFELRQGIIEEDDVAYSMPKGSTGEDARMLLRHSTVKEILDQLNERARDTLAAKEVDDFAEFGSYEGLDQPKFKGLSRVIPPRRPSPSDVMTVNALESPNAQELIKMSPLAHLGWEANPAIGTIPSGNIVSTHPDGRRVRSLAQHFSGGYGDLGLLEGRIPEWGPPTPAAYDSRGIIFGAGSIPRTQADGGNIDVAGVPNSNKGNRVRGYAHGDMVAAPRPQQPQQPNPIVMGAVAAIKGQHPEPQKAVMAFVQTYGQPAFAKLRQQVLMAERQGTGLGGGAVRGPGDGLSDSVPANIDGQEPVALSDGEVVVPADVVSGLGNGSSEAGAQVLEGMNDKVRQTRTGKKNQPGAINPAQMLPA